MSDETKPTGTAAYYDALAEKLKQGTRHSSLGANLRGVDDWWSAGKSKFEKLLRGFAIGRDDRVVEYGCGSLRVGAHFIRHLDRGRYFGLDVSQGLVDIGRELLGEALLREKAPRLAAIDERSLAEAARFDAAFVFASAVAYCVQPDENDEFLRNLARLAHRPGAVLFFDTKMAEPGFPYGGRCWARPLDVYLKGLSPLAFVKMHSPQKVKEGNKAAGSTSAVLEFRRARP